MALTACSFASSASRFKIIKTFTAASEGVVWNGGPGAALQGKLYAVNVDVAGAVLRNAFLYRVNLDGTGFERLIDIDPSNLGGRNVTTSIVAADEDRLIVGLSSGLYSFVPGPDTWSKLSDTWLREVYFVSDGMAYGLSVSQLLRPAIARLNISDPKSLDILHEFEPDATPLTFLRVVDGHDAVYGVKSSLGRAVFFRVNKLTKEYSELGSFDISSISSVPGAFFTGVSLAYASGQVFGALSAFAGLETFQRGELVWRTLFFALSADGSDYTFLRNVDFNGTNFSNFYGTASHMHTDGKLLYIVMGSGGGRRQSGGLMSMTMDGSKTSKLATFDEASGPFPVGRVILAGDQLYGWNVGSGGSGAIWSYSLTTKASAPKPTGPKSQKIKFKLPLKIVYGGSYLLRGTSTSKLPVVYEINDADAAYVAGNQLNILKPDIEFTVTAKQAGNSAWSEASPVALKAVASKRPQTIGFSVKRSAPVGTVLTLLVTINSPLEVTVSSSDLNVIRINSDGTATALAKGKATLTAAQGGNENYAAAKSVKRTVTVR